MITYTDKSTSMVSIYTITANNRSSITTYRAQGVLAAISTFIHVATGRFHY